MRPMPLGTLLLLAVLAGSLNCLKPLTIDDAAYYAYARQAAGAPLDPYGFPIFWYSFPEPAHMVLAPPLLNYVLSLPMRFSDTPALWKIIQIPFLFVLALATHSLGRRWAPGGETPLVVMLLFSPAVLPATNLMLDIPALSLSLASLSLFTKAVDRASPALACLAGLVAGLGMQTKYTAVAGPVAMLLFSLFHGRIVLALIAGIAAGHVFVVWEFLIGLLYGEAHFFSHARMSPGSFLKWHNFRYLIPLLGSVGLPVCLLALFGLGVSRRVLLGTILGWLSLLGFLGLVDTERMSWLERMSGGRLPTEQFFFGIFGIFIIGITLLLIERLLRVSRLWGMWVQGVGPPMTTLRLWRKRPKAWFLVSWLILELLVYMALTPFPAVRRLLGVLTVGLFLAGRLASQRVRLQANKSSLGIILVFTVGIGLFYQAIDVVDAQAPRTAIDNLTREREAHRPVGTVWYVGQWGFQYYADKAGMVPLVSIPGPESLVPLPPHTRLRVGDWLVLPQESMAQQPFQRDVQRTEYVFSLRVEDRLPWRTVRCYYGGFTAVEHQSGPRFEMAVYRVTEEHMADPGKPVEP